MTDLRGAPWGLKQILQPFRRDGIKDEAPFLVHRDEILIYRMTQGIGLAFIVIWAIAHWGWK